MTATAVAAIGDPMMLSCGAGDCETDHMFYTPNRLILVMEGIPGGEALGDLEETVETCIEKGTLVQGETKVFPTILGMWWDATFQDYAQN